MNRSWQLSRSISLSLRSRDELTATAIVDLLHHRLRARATDPVTIRLPRQGPLDRIPVSILRPATPGALDEPVSWARPSLVDDHPCTSSISARRASRKSLSRS